MKGGLRLIVLFVAVAALGGPPAAQQNSTDDVIRGLQARVKLYPNDYATYDGLGAAYLQKGRETADAQYYDLAEIALRKSLDLLSNDPAAAPAMTNMAVACMFAHRFQDALKWAEDAVAQGSGDPSPWAIVGDALADMGDYAGSAEAYSKLQSAEGSEGERLAISYQHDSRVSSLRMIAGDTTGALGLMRSALKTSLESHMPAENIAWSDYQLGEELFQTGDIAGAEGADLAALQKYPGYYRALAGLGKVRVSQERYAEAIELYQKAFATVPYPEFAAALGDIYQKTGDAAQAKKQYDTVEFIGFLSQANQEIHNRDLALFYADHDLKLGESLELARKEFEVRADVYTWDVLAWSLVQEWQVPRGPPMRSLMLSAKEQRTRRSSFMRE